MKRKALIQQVEELGIQAVGGKLYKKFLHGEKLTRQESISAMCYECMGYYHGGKEDCGNTNCPLYPYNHYGTDKSQKIVKNMTEETKRKRAKNLEKARKAKNTG